MSLKKFEEIKNIEKSHFFNSEVFLFFSIQCFVSK